MKMYNDYNETEVALALGKNIELEKYKRKKTTGNSINYLEKFSLEEIEFLNLFKKKYVSDIYLFLIDNGLVKEESIYDYFKEISDLNIKKSIKYLRDKKLAIGRQKDLYANLVLLRKVIKKMNKMLDVAGINLEK